MWFVRPGTTSCLPRARGTQNEWITPSPIAAGGAPSGGPGWHVDGVGLVP